METVDIAHYPSFLSNEEQYPLKITYSLRMRRLGHIYAKRIQMLWLMLAGSTESRADAFCSQSHPRSIIFAKNSGRVRGK